MTVRSLSTDLLRGAPAPPTTSTGAGADARAAADGTHRASPASRSSGRLLHRARLRARPDRARRCAAPRADCPGTLLQYTASRCRRRGESALDPATPARSAAARRCRCRSATAGRSRDPQAPRARSARLGRTADTFGVATTDRRRAHHLRRGARASSATSTATSPTASGRPARDYPLDAFLFEDKIGYCQQFSGAMALMLRMAGHPGPGGRRLLARVATTATAASTACATSTPTRGSRSASTASAGCRSTRRPPAAPAESQSSGLGAPSAAPRRRRRGDAPQRRPRRVRAGGRRATAPPADAGRGRPSPWWPLLPLVAARRRRGCSAGALCRARRASAELRAGRGPARRAAPRARAARLRAAGRPPRCSRSSGAWARLAGPAAARYAAALQGAPLRPARPGAPPLAGRRRALRRELTARGGLRGRLLRTDRAIPPGGPSRSDRAI